MDAKTPAPSKSGQSFPRGLLAGLDGHVARQLVAAAGDVAMLIDRDGVIRDMAVGNADLARDGAGSWLDRPWQETVSIDSRPKVEALLRDAAAGARLRWREINQVAPDSTTLLVRYVAVDAGQDGRVIAIGRDERAVAAVQQRLMEAQQAMERDYARLREAEGRYRLLFSTSGEAVLVVDAATRRVVEANRAAERALAAARSGASPSRGDAAGLAGAPFATLFDGESQDEATALLGSARASAPAPPVVRLVSGGQPFEASASVFRQDRGSYWLVRLDTPGNADRSRGAHGPDLGAILQRIPDAFLVTDDQMRILTANTAFLDLAHLGAAEAATGLPLSRFLGREGLERNILLDALREHGSVRNFRTVLRTDLGDTEDVEVSGVSAPQGQGEVYGFTIRSVERRLGERAEGPPALRRSVEQLTELVGRTTLKDLVRETTDLVERLCIEAALELTKNNRASAAEVLGLSRQSLYSKLHRFGLGNLAGNEA